jgi:periplasmic divalent cation tolerance protein
MYQWKGEIAVDSEALLIIKTSSEKVEQLRVRVLEQHPYELPEFLVLHPSAASEPYARWIVESVR